MQREMYIWINLSRGKEAMKYTFAREEEISYAPSFTFMGFQYAR